MSVSSVLLIAVSIVAVEGSTATIDAGRSQHLETGDRGQAFYELIVDGIPKRIEAGSVVVIDVENTSATLTSESGVPLRPGHRVELHLPLDRMPKTLSTRPASPPLKRPDSAPLDRQDSAYSKQPDSAPLKRPASAPAVPSESVDPEPGGETEVSPSVGEGLAPSLAIPAPEPPVPLRDVVNVTADSYLIGLDPSEADFFNQTPRHEVLLPTFSIDRRPLGEGLAPSPSGGSLTGVDFIEARSHCQSLGLRLPSEQEWEIAAQTPGFVLEPGLFEWTASWYQAYPGNSRNEEEYGQTRRVLRGVADGSMDTLFSRRYMSPDQRNSNVGFRCARDPR